MRWGEVVLGEGKVYSLLFANNMVLLAEREEEIRSMVERLEGYINRKSDSDCGKDYEVHESRREKKESKVELKKKGDRRGERV